MSIKLYFFLVVTLLGLGLGGIFYSMTTSYFIKGFDTVLYKSMMRVAQDYDADVGEHVSILEFTLANEWQDLPDGVRGVFTQPPAYPGELVKHIVRDNPIARPEALSFAMQIQGPHGKFEHVVKSIDFKDWAHVQQGPTLNRLWVLGFGLIIALSIILFMALMMRSITTPYSALATWTRRLERESLVIGRPDFRYAEFNKLADLVRSSLIRVHEALDREHEFLKQASHELRTPITVISNSTDLLEDTIEDNTSKQAKAVGRISRATKTMTSLTETLLWLARETHNDMEFEVFDLGTFIQSLVDDHSYLLRLKPEVSVKTELDQTEILLPKEPARIVISNLIRNAFQHSFEQGVVRISQRGSMVTVFNSCDHSVEANENDIGFGLGLELCRKLCDRFGWRLRAYKRDEDFCVELRL